MVPFAEGPGGAGVNRTPRPRKIATMNKLLAIVIVLALAGPAYTWNEHGHMVVARLAWNQLNDDQRAKVVAILKKHPHYDEYLAARRPVGFTEDEWVFMRAAAWPDWVRGKRDFDHPTWHYINYPVVPPGSSVKASDHEPPAGQVNIVSQLAVCDGQDSDRLRRREGHLHVLAIPPRRRHPPAAALRRHVQ